MCFPPPENRAVYEMMWKNNAQPDRSQMTIWRVHIACCLPTATNTYSEYVILIACPLQQWLHERAWMLRSTFIAYLVIIFYVNFSLQRGSNASSTTLSPEIRLAEIIRSCLLASGVHSIWNEPRVCSHLILKPQVLWISPSNDAYRSNVSYFITSTCTAVYDDYSKYSNIISWL